MPPEHGARIELKFVNVEPGSVRYAIALKAKGSAWSGSASIDLGGGAIEFIGLESGPPTWLLDLVRALLRTVYRNHHGDGSWPRRLTRWRPEPSSR